MYSVKESSNNFCEVDTAGGKMLVYFEIRRSKKSRHFRLNIDPINTVIVTIPWRASEKEAIQFLKSHGDWIDEHYKKSTRHVTLFEYLHKNKFISSASQKLSLNIGFIKGGPTLLYDDSAGAVTIRFDPGHDREEPIKQVLYPFSRDLIKKHALNLADRHDINVKQVTVRDQSTVWGTCTEDAHVSLNWRLILLEPELHDYIILHELAHLIHLDHSHLFWNLLRHYDTRAIAHDRRIKLLSNKIMALGRCPAKVA